MSVGVDSDSGHDTDKDFDENFLTGASASRQSLSVPRAEEASSEENDLTSETGEQLGPDGSVHVELGELTAADTSVRQSNTRYRGRSKGKRLSGDGERELAARGLILSDEERLNTPPPSEAQLRAHLRHRERVSRSPRPSTSISRQSTSRSLTPTPSSSVPSPVAPVSATSAIDPSPLAQAAPTSAAVDTEDVSTAAEQKEGREGAEASARTSNTTKDSVSAPVLNTVIDPAVDPVSAATTRRRDYQSSGGNRSDGSGAAKRNATHAVIPKIAPEAYPSRYVGRHEPRSTDYRSPWRFELDTIVYLCKNYVLLCLNVQTFLTMGLALGFYFLFYFLELGIDMPLSLIAVSLVFPISFGISYTANRREAALKEVASIKASAISLFYCARNWPAHNQDLTTRFHECIYLLLRYMRHFLSNKTGPSTLTEVYRQFDELSLLCEELRQQDEWVKSVVSRAYQYVRYMQADFERIRVVHDYRTIPALRGFGFVYLTLFGALLAPHFALVGEKFGIWAGIYCSVLANLMLVNLYRILYELEDPFEFDADEDINLDVLKEVDLHMWNLADDDPDAAPTFSDLDN